MTIQADEPEFTDDQLRAALKRMGRDAREATFRAGLPIVIYRAGTLVAIHADGREETVEILAPESNGTEMK